MLTEFDCDLDPSPVVCGNINAYPTFCCPDDDKCRAHVDNVQVGYDHDAGMDDLAATVAAKCDEKYGAKPPLPACPANRTVA